MKKFLLFIAAAFALHTAHAQQLTLQLSNPPATIVGGYTQSYPLEATFDVVNTGTQALDISVARIILSEVTGSVNNFCWGVNCYPPTVSVSPQPQTIAAGATDNSFIADYEPQNNAGVTTIKYCFFDVNNTSDSVCTTINFDATAAVASLKDLAAADKPGIELSSANPAGDLAMFQYYVPSSAKEAKLVVHSITGSLVKEVNLRKGNGNLVFATNGLTSGLYIYSLVTDGTVISSQKLSVKH